MAEERSPFAPLIQKHEGRVFLTPCLDFTLYWSGDVFEHAAAIIRFVDNSLSVVGSELKFFRTETMTSAKRLKPDSLRLVHFWLNETSTRRDVYSLFLESGAFPDEPSDVALAFDASPGMGYVRLILPASRGIDDPDTTLSLALDLARPFEFSFGTLGYGINWNHLKTVRRSQMAMNSIAARYRGIDLSYPLSTKFIVHKGIKCISWVTFVGRVHLDRSDTLSRLGAIAPNFARVHNLDFGVAVQAGDRPSLGDVNRQESLEAYHAVGGALAPIRAQQQPAIFGPGGIPDEDATSAWLARFDD